MKQIHKNIILSAGLLFASAGLMAQTDVEKTDTLAQKVNVACLPGSMLTDGIERKRCFIRTCSSRSVPYVFLL